MFTKAVILHNLRSAHNVGSIFRTADAVGINKIYLTGYTPTPLDRFGQTVKEIEKTALGAEKVVAWEKVEDINGLILELKKDNFKIIAVEQSEKALDYKAVRISNEEKVVMIFGNEVGGVEPSILNECDIIAEIPMRGEKESLNVSVAAGIVLFGWLDH